MKKFDIRFSFWENDNFHVFWGGYFLGNFLKNRSQKSSMLEEKQEQFWNLHQIPTKLRIPIFNCYFFISGFFWNKKK